MDLFNEEKIDDNLYTHILACFISEFEPKESYNAGRQLGERISDDFFLKTSCNNKVDLNFICSKLIPDFFSMYFSYKIKYVLIDKYYVFSFDDFYLFKNFKEYDILRILEFYKGQIMRIIEYVYDKSVDLECVKDEFGFAWRIKIK